MTATNRAHPIAEYQFEISDHVHQLLETTSINITKTTAGKSLVP